MSIKVKEVKIAKKSGPVCSFDHFLKAGGFLFNEAARRTGYKQSSWGISQGSAYSNPYPTVHKSPNFEVRIFCFTQAIYFEFLPDIRSFDW